MPSGYRLCGRAPREVRDMAPTADGHSVHFVCGGLGGILHGAAHRLCLQHLPSEGERPFNYLMRTTERPVFAFVSGRRKLSVLLEEETEDLGDYEQSVVLTRDLHRHTNKVGASWLRRPSRVGPMEGDLLAGSQNATSPEIFVLTTKNYHGDCLRISKVCGPSVETVELRIPFAMESVQDVVPVRDELLICYADLDHAAQDFALSTKHFTRLRFNQPDKAETIETVGDAEWGFPDQKGHLNAALDALWVLSEIGNGELRLWRLDLGSLRWKKLPFHPPCRFYEPMFRTLPSGKAFVVEQRIDPPRDKEVCQQVLTFWLAAEPPTLQLLAFDVVARSRGLGALSPKQLRHFGIPHSLVKWL